MPHVAIADRETSADIQARITPLYAQRKRVTADLAHKREKLEAARDSYAKGNGPPEALGNFEGDVQALERVLKKLDAELDAEKTALKEVQHREYLDRTDAAIADAKKLGEMLIAELDDAVQEFSRDVEEFLREIEQAEQAAYRAERGINADVPRGTQLVPYWKPYAHGPTNMLRSVATQIRDYRQWRERQDLRRRRT